MSLTGPAVASFGCRLNMVEGAAIRAMLPDAADLVVVNTCTVTARAERDGRQAIRRAQRERPSAAIIVTGCAAQIATRPPGPRCPA